MGDQVARAGSSPAALPRQDRRTGITLRVTAWLMMGAGGAVGLGGVVPVTAAINKLSGGHYGTGQYLLFWLGSVTAFTLGSVAFRRGRRLDVRGRQHLARVIDTSSPLLAPGAFVLYLRSFEDDSAWQVVHSIGHSDESDLWRNLMLSGLTREEQLVAALRPAGTVVALGRPGEQLPQVGALRLYEPDASWRQTVRDLLGQARLVVFAIGTGENLIWEFVQALAIVPPERVVLIATERQPYAVFRAEVSRALSRDRRRARRGAPVLPGEPPVTRTSDVRGWVISFGPDWRATLTTFPLPWGRLQYRNQTRKEIRKALRPVLDRVAAGAGPAAAR